MPTYTFKDKNTGETFDVSMPIAEIDTYENSNPHLERVYAKVAICDPAGIGVSKPPSDFSKYVLGKVATVPGARKEALEKRWTIPKEY